MTEDRLLMKQIKSKRDESFFHVKGNTEDFLCLSFSSTFSESVGDKYASTVPDLFLQVAQVRILYIFLNDGGISLFSSLWCRRRINIVKTQMIAEIIKYTVSTYPITGIGSESPGRPSDTRVRKTAKASRQLMAYPTRSHYLMAK